MPEQVQNYIYYFSSEDRYRNVSSETQSLSPANLNFRNKNLKAVLAAVCELEGGAGWPKGMSQLLSFFSAK